MANVKVIIKVGEEAEEWKEDELGTYAFKQHYIIKGLIIDGIIKPDPQTLENYRRVRDALEEIMKPIFALIKTK